MFIVLTCIFQPGQEASDVAILLRDIDQINVEVKAAARKVR